MPPVTQATQINGLLFTLAGNANVDTGQSTDPTGIFNLNWTSWDSGALISTRRVGEHSTFQTERQFTTELNGEFRATTDWLALCCAVLAVPLSAVRCELLSNHQPTLWFWHWGSAIQTTHVVLRRFSDISSYTEQQVENHSLRAYNTTLQSSLLCSLLSLSPSLIVGNKGIPDVVFKEDLSSLNCLEMQTVVISQLRGE